MVAKSFSLISALSVGLLWGSVGSLAPAGAQTAPTPLPTLAPQESAPTEGTLQYDLAMQAGYAAAQARDYAEALEHFRAAQLIRPQDIYARQAIFNVETYETLRQQKLPAWWWVVPLLPVAAMGALGLFFWNLHRSQQDFLEEVLERRQQFQPLQDNLRDRGVTGNTVVNPALPYPVQDFGQAQILSSSDVGAGEILAPAFAPNFPEDESLESQIQGLNDPRRRKKVIWDLARRGDSRAVKPLVDLMAESDAQERSLILEALSQISGRTLKPMNEALALSLQDLNPQVRKNAVRDLSRLYDVLSQISQLLADAVYDQDEEVQETAKWALSQFQSPGSSG